MRQISIIVAIATFLCSCHNHTNEMIEYCTDDSVICCKVPSYLQLTKTEGHTLYFEGNKRIAKILIVPSADRETKDFYINNIVGDSRSEISLVEDNDSITAYEIQRGMISIPAYIISMHERNGYAVMLVTYGIDLDIHKNDFNGQNVLHHAVRLKQKESILYLVKYDADFEILISKKDIKGNIPKDLDKTKSFENELYTIWDAAKDNDINKLNLLLNKLKYYTINEKTKFKENSPLHLAVKNRADKAVLFLILNGADKNIKNKEGLDPLEY